MSQRPRTILEMFDEDIDELEKDVDEDQFDFLDSQTNRLNQEEYTLPQILEEPDESQSLESQQMNANQQLVTNAFEDYEVPVLVLDDDSQISQCRKIRLTGFKSYVKQQNLEKQQIEQQFVNIVRAQAELLLQNDKKEQIIKNAQKQMKPSKLQEKIAELLSVPEVTQNDTLITKPQKKSGQTRQKQLNCNIESLQEEILSLQQRINEYKLRYNEDQELIKALKLQLQKSEVNQSRTSSSTQASKVDDLVSENEKLKYEIIVLKKQYSQENENLKHQYQKSQKIQQGIQQKKVQEQQIPDKAQQLITKLSAEITQQKCEFRNKFLELKQVNALKEQQICKLQIEMKKQQELKEKPDQQQQQIESLQIENKKLQQDILEVKEKYMFDNQLKLLFPSQQENIIKVMNIFLVFENQTKVRKLVKKIAFRFFNPIFQRISSGIQWFYSLIKYKWTKQSVHHPDNKQVIIEAMKKIRANPTVVESENIQMSKEISIFREENNQLRNKISQLEQFLGEKTQYYNQLDELVKIDKIQLANQLMMRILKKEAEDRQLNQEQNIPELEQIKVQRNKTIKLEIFRINLIIYPPLKNNIK